MLDSALTACIEVLSGVVLLVRLSLDMRTAQPEMIEFASLRLVGISFLLLAAYIGYDSVSLLLTHAPLAGRKHSGHSPGCSFTDRHAMACQRKTQDCQIYWQRCIGCRCKTHRFLCLSVCNTSGWTVFKCPIWVLVGRPISCVADVAIDCQRGTGWT